MALTNIEYGSLASSAVINSNFSYLDDRISDSSESIMTNISSILSNIATINTRLNTLSDGIEDAVEELNTKLEGYKNKLKLLTAKACIVPNWSGITGVTITANTAYIPQSNGYLIITPGSSQINLTINEKTIQIKTGQVATIPVRENDSVVMNSVPSAVSFLPVAEVSVENL